MTMSADNLKQNLSNPAKTYLWDVLFVNPIGGGDAETLEVRCQSTNIPGRGVGQILVPFKNTPGIVYPGKPTVPHTWDCNFIEGTDGKVREILDAWEDSIVNLRTGVGLPDIAIKSDIYLRLLTPPGSVYRKIKLVGCYPQEIPDVPLAYTDEGNILYPTTWAYDRWEKVS